MNSFLRPRKRLCVTTLILVVCLVSGCGISPFDFLAQFTAARLLFGDGSPTPSAMPPTGYYEVTSPSNVSAQWEDPDAPLAQMIGTASLQQSYLMFQPGARLFLFFDVTGRILHAIDYLAGEEALYVAPSGPTAIVGAAANRWEKSWTYTIAYPPTVHDNKSVEQTLFISIQDGDPAKERGLTAHLNTRFTLTQDIPADPGTGTPLIPAGEVAIGMIEQSFMISPTASPFAQFEGASVQTKPDNM